MVLLPVMRPVCPYSGMQTSQYARFGRKTKENSRLFFGLMRMPSPKIWATLSFFLPKTPLDSKKYTGLGPPYFQGGVSANFKIRHPLTPCRQKFPTGGGSCKALAFNFLKFQKPIKTPDPPPEPSRPPPNPPPPPPPPFPKKKIFFLEL